MKVLFIQKQLFPYFGILSLSGFLINHRHDAFVMINPQLNGRDLNKIKEIKPDLIAFSLMSSEHVWFVKKVKFLKEYFPSIPIIAGGVHAILYPEDLASIAGVDYVCYGEGEYTLLQLLDHLKFSAPIEEVKGIAFKRNGKIQKTTLNKLVGLDTFYEDRSIYYDFYNNLKSLPLKVFVSSRGCPYKCSFCINVQLQKTFKDLGSYVRRKNVEKFVAEMKEVKDNYGMRSIYIADDLFAMNKDWLKEFTYIYKKKIGIPYICTCRADMLDEDIVRYLADSGCHTVTFGVETGNQNLRTKILNKNISDEQLFLSAKLLTRAGLRYQTSNMFCLPGETVEDAIETIDLNIKLGSSFAMSAIFLPFPRTELTELCIKMGILKPDYSFEDMPHSFITRSVLAIKDKETIERLQKVSGIVIQYPRLRNIMVFCAKHITVYYLHFFLYLIGTVLRFHKERKINIFNALRYIWSYRKSV